MTIDRISGSLSSVSEDEELNGLTISSVALPLLPLPDTFRSDATLT